MQKLYFLLFVGLLFLVKAPAQIITPALQMEIIFETNLTDYNKVKTLYENLKVDALVLECRVVPDFDADTPMYQSGMSPPYIKEENGRYILYTVDMDTIHLPANDLAGNPRIAYGRIDMGAYEFADTTISIPSPPKRIAGQIRTFPNPFRGSVGIEFTLLSSGCCEVLIHDIRGRKIKTLMNAQTQPGNYQMRWNAHSDAGLNVPTGHYIISILLDGQKAGSAKIERW